MSKRKHRRYYGIRCMLAILITGALVTSGGFVLRRTLLKDLPQYDGAPDIALPLMLLQDNSPVLEARERAAWEAENGDSFDDVEYAMEDEDEAGLAELVDSFDDSQETGVMSVFNNSASAQTLSSDAGLPSLDQLADAEEGSALTDLSRSMPTAEPDETLEPMAMAQVYDEPIEAAGESEGLVAVADLSNMATAEPDEPLEPAGQAGETLEAAAETKAEPATVAKAKKKVAKKKKVTAKYFNKTLFIGDSRTNGLQIWGRIGKAHYFCGTGYSVFNIAKKTASDEGHFKNVTLAQVLKKYRYNQVYIMLGFNESGYPYASLMKQYRYVISMVHKAQPKAKIILHGILHTSYKVACRDKWASISNLEKINDGLRAFAKDKKYIYYVDCNDAFCNDNGYLKDGTSSDGEHLNPKYTKLWAKEIMKRAI